MRCSGYSPRCYWKYRQAVVWLGSTVSMHTREMEKRKKRRKKKQGGKVINNIETFERRKKKKQGRLKMIHFWPGSFVIVALPPLALHMHKEQQRKYSQLQGWRKDGGSSLLPDLSFVQFLICCLSIVLDAPVVLVLFSPPSSSSCCSVYCCSFLFFAITSCFPGSSRVEELVLGSYQGDLIILCFGSLPRCLNIASGWVSVVKLS